VELHKFIKDDFMEGILDTTRKAIGWFYKKNLYFIDFNIKIIDNETHSYYLDNMKIKIQIILLLIVMTNCQTPKTNNEQRKAIFLKKEE
jgi:hypothetical protein